MQFLAKLLLGLAVLLLVAQAVKASPDAPTTAEFCEAMGELAGTVAAARDRGAPEGEMQALAVRGIERERTRRIIGNVVRTVYEQPSQTPARAAYLTERACMLGMAGKLM
jgi:malonyl CoA-acyl carrier protein transacylase